ncbi:MAG TPA: hypothetical protein VFR05_02065 [Terriglobia bacterium]|nr:hypothetical protein [Terriglobia bacterium]
MKQCLRAMVMVVCLVPLLGIDAYAQAATATPPAVVLKLQVTVSRYMGTNRVSSQPFVLSLVPNESGNIRVGVEVPIPASAAPASTTTPPAPAAPQQPYNFQQVGTQIDGNAVLQPDGRYRIRLGVTERSALTATQATEQGARVPTVPAFRNVVFGSTIYLGDGQTTQFSSGGDRVSGEVFRVDVSLTIEK